MLFSHPFQGINPLPRPIVTDLDRRPFTQQVDSPEQRHATAGPVPSDPACQANHQAVCLLSYARGRAVVVRLGAIARASGFDDARITRVTLARHGFVGEFDNRRFSI